MVEIAVIEVKQTDLEELLGESVDVDELEERGSMLGILFEDTEEENKIAVEVEPNRADLLSAEGVARALRGFFEIQTGAVKYPVEDGNMTVTVEDSVEDVRPCIACAHITGLELTETKLNSLIQLQEKLTETYGRKREKIAIGLHDAAPLTADITYKAVEPDDVSFVPLGADEEMTLEEILEQHEKGKAYGWIVEGLNRYPLLVDSDDTVLSFPPVINGVATEVTVDTQDIFLDVTGTSQQEVETALNILVAALHERGGTIEAVTVDDTTYPDMEPATKTLDAEYVRTISGLDDLSADGMKAALEKMNYDASLSDGALNVDVPAYRADIMHDYDVIEDIVIGYGYNNVDEEIPDISTIGGESQQRVFANRLREFMVGVGAQELMTFILSNTEKLFDRMELDEQEIVEMSNPLTEDYAAVRNWLLPSLMEVIANNQHNRYPQRIFEVGTCSRLTDNTATGAEDVQKLAYATANNDANFTEARSVLQSLAAYLGVELTVEETEHDSFTEKRCGRVKFNGEEVGIIGEVSDAVCKNWEIDVGIAAFELDVDAVHACLA